MGIMKNIAMDVIDLHEQGCSVDEIANLLGMTPFEVSGTIVHFADIVCNEEQYGEEELVAEPGPYEFEDVPF